MKLRRFLAMATAAIGITPFLLVVLPASSAFAHGYISSPPSRQAQCAQGTVPCGPIKYEPQSVEGPKGLRSCSGGNAPFADLDDDGKGWRATSVGNSVTFTWTFTARHRTRDYEYYLNGQRVALVDGGNVQPPPTVSHTVNLGGATGRQKLLAIWNIGDTPMAFYACVDLQIGGGGTPTTSPTTSTTTRTTTTTPPPGGTWAANTAYQVGSQVTYNGSTYRCTLAHTSLPGWEPPNTPALWQQV
ncbi:lytic polysaccharide monooxygenase [Crossiella cryophila]|uniref:Chitin-binding protein n=1 Tax=Crossiella cryophila TaxID=43355 RepID=A0A7W7CFH1_9PSEU|nr:lytic polysaccharide monooxygenase [Crossiella cryophila]MBB4680231.1 chitin-binding protein [Crossiella cryophila]